MPVLFCKGCGSQLRKFGGGKRFAMLVVVKKRNGKWVEVRNVEVRNKETKEGIGKDEKIFFKCLNCDFLNKDF